MKNAKFILNICSAVENNRSVKIPCSIMENSGLFQSILIIISDIMEHDGFAKKQTNRLVKFI